MKDVESDGSGVAEHQRSGIEVGTRSHLRTDHRGESFCSGYCYRLGLNNGASGASGGIDNGDIDIVAENLGTGMREEDSLQGDCLVERGDSLP